MAQLHVCAAAQHLYNSVQLIFRKKKKRKNRWPSCMCSSSALVQFCAIHFQEEEEEESVAQMHIKMPST